MRYKLTIEYDGTDYCGFQKQFNIPYKSIEEALEEAVFKLSHEGAKIIVCGRTDSGVHACGQVVHFDLSKEFEIKQVVMGLNHHLSKEKIVVLDCEIVDEEFHSRFNAKMRHYRYIILNRIAPPILEENRVWHVRKELNFSAMQETAKELEGSHDFTSFRDRHCQGNSPIRTIQKIELSQDGDKIIVDISAKSFLHHMVRNIVGTLSWAGLGKIEASDIKSILESKDRTNSGPNAPSHGLYFMKVDY